MHYDLIFEEKNGWAAMDEMNKNYKHKSVLGKVYRNKYSQRKYIGKCVELRNILKPSSVQDFRNKLESYAEEHIELPIYQRGPTNMELFDLANKYRDDCCKIMPELEKYDVMFYYNLLLHHQTTETFNGCKKEEILCKYLDSKSIKWRHATSDEDSKYCTDIFILNNNGIEQYGVQIKPYSFLKGKQADLQNDRNKLLLAMSSLKEDINIGLIFAVYNKKLNKWLKNPKRNGFTFRFAELFNVVNNNVITNDLRGYVWQNLPI